MKNNLFKRSIVLFLALVCVLGTLPLSAFAAGAAPPASITQLSSNYVSINGRFVRYHAASDVINNVGLPFVFHERVDVPGFGPVRALCAHQIGALGLAKEAMDLVRDHPEYFRKYRLWIYDWDESRPWKLVGQEGTPMQKLLVAVPEAGPSVQTVRLTVKKLEAGTN